MPRYEYRCRTCESVFELERPMARSGDPADCPSGHHDTVKLLSMFAATSGSGDSLRGTAPAVAPSGGGGCGGHCACH